LGPDGVTALRNGTGIRLEGTRFSIVGGAASAERNVVSNNDDGILLNGALDAVVLSNLIGTSPSGTLDRGNADRVSSFWEILSDR
jgi:hypothetical protein